MMQWSLVLVINTVLNLESVTMPVAYATNVSCVFLSTDYARCMKFRSCDCLLTA